MQVHDNLFNLLCWVDLDLFYAKIKLGHLSFYVGRKRKVCIFPKTIAAYFLKVGRCPELNNLMKLLEYQRSRSFFDLDKVTRFSSLNPVFLKKTLVILNQIPCKRVWEHRNENLYK